ncbi:hypothetical protein HerbRD11066_68890 [Herbidospora sp. RD11066]
MPALIGGDQAARHQQAAPADLDGHQIGRRGLPLGTAVAGVTARDLPFRYGHRYQLAFVMPGSSPRWAISRNLIRERPNLVR